MNGYTLNGGNASAWDDIWELAPDLEQATPASQPTYSATGGPNSTPIISGNGAQWLEQNTATVVPFDADWEAYIVCRAGGANNAFFAYLYDQLVWLHPGSQTYATEGGGYSATDTGPAAGNWVLLRVRRVDDTHIAIRIDDQAEQTTAIPAGSVGMTQVTALVWFGDAASNAEIVCRTPTDSAEDAAFIAYFNDRYGWSL